MASSGPSLLESAPRVICAGLSSLAADLRAAGAQVSELRWRPPAGGDAQTLAMLSRLEREHAAAIEDGNREALSRILRAEPVLVDVKPAAEVVPGLEDRMILHAGPPIEWARMCGPMRGAVAGAAVFQGWAPDLTAATEMAAEGGLRFAPNHDHGTVGPMTGLTTARMPVMVVENRTFGNRAYCTLNEGVGKVMRFGGNDPEVIARLHWLAEVLGPALAGALASRPVELGSLIARGLAMGDEMHQRNVACTSLLIRALAPALARAGDRGAEVLEFMAGNDQFFLNVAMALGKAIMDPVRAIPASTVVTAMARNGTDFGIRLGGCADQWFVAPVEMPQGLYFPGFTAADANPDMGDSTIVETIGLGGFAMAAAPAVAGFVGAGSAAEAARFTRSMGEITLGAHPEWRIPALEFAGVPVGIDARAVVHCRVVPTINTGIAHRRAGVGQVGAGVVKAPYACFLQALQALEQRLAGGAAR